MLSLWLSRYDRSTRQNLGGEKNPEGVQPMKAVTPSRLLFPRQLALVLLASAIAVPTLAQQATAAANPKSAPAATVEQRPSPVAPPSPSMNAPKEGFWGRVNPFARKKWVNKRMDPLKDRLNELDEVNAKNARIFRTWIAGRRQASARPSPPPMRPTRRLPPPTAGQEGRCHGAERSGHVDQLNSTVNGLDKYGQVERR